MLISCIIALFGFFILLSGIIILVYPSSILSLFRKKSESRGLYAFAIIARLILGTVLVVYAVESKYPITIQILGWLSITAAIIFVIMSHSRFKKLISWVLDFTPTFMQVAGFSAILFGGFLIYAVV